MITRINIRRLAMQILYQLDMRGERDAQAILDSLADGMDEQGVVRPAFELAMAAWSKRKSYDDLITHLAPEWPTQRQPVVDRSILRLATHEMKTGFSPAAVAINEAVELAKVFAGRDSPVFINGVLDKIAQRLPAGSGVSQGDSVPTKTVSAQTSAAVASDPWLADAMEDELDEPEKP